MEMRPEYFPRSFTISSGEDLPRGASIRARMICIELEPNEIRLDVLTAIQTKAAAGVLASCMAGYLQWLAPQLDEMKKNIPARIIALRDEFSALSKSHGRTPTTAASLFIGFESFFAYALESGAMEPAEAERLKAECRAAFVSLGEEQGRLLETEDLVNRFFELLQSAISSGRAFLAGIDGGEPNAPERWGWRRETRGQSEEWRPQGEKIGWIDPETATVFLDPDGAFAVIQRLAADQGGRMTTTARTLWKRLDEAGRLGIKEKGRHFGKVTVEGRQRRVLNILYVPLSPVEIGINGINGIVVSNPLINSDLESEKLSRLFPDSQKSGLKIGINPENQKNEIPIYPDNYPDNQSISNNRDNVTSIKSACKESQIPIIPIIPISADKRAAIEKSGTYEEF